MVPILMFFIDFVMGRNDQLVNFYTVVYLQFSVSARCLPATIYDQGSVAGRVDFAAMHMSHQLPLRGARQHRPIKLLHFVFSLNAVHKGLTFDTGC